MRLFRMDGEGVFTEYKEQDFKDEHTEETLESWIERNPDAIIEDGKLLIIGRQVATNLNSYIDLLALDRQGNLAVCELKRDRTPRDTLAQVLEYASFAAGLDYDQIEQIFRSYMRDEHLSLSGYHRTFFELAEEVAVSFNKDQRAIIVGQAITPGVRQTAVFLRQKGFRVTCVEFKYFRTDSDERLLSVDRVVGEGPLGRSPVSTAALPTVTRDQLLGACDEAGRRVFEDILALAKRPDLIHWGSRGFSLNVDVQGAHVALCFGYPPESVYRQSVYTAFNEIRKKVLGAAEVICEFRERFVETRLFISAQSELKYLIRAMPEEEKIGGLIQLLTDLTTRIAEAGLITDAQSGTA